MKIEWPKKERLQQGMIFSNCLVPGYEGCDGWGLVITARCDLANQKVPILNYLPIVLFEDWIKEDGRDVVIGRAWAEEEGSIKSLLKDLGASETVLLGTDLTVVLARILGELDEKRRKSFEGRCAKAGSRYESFTQNGGPAIEWLRSEYPKIYGAVVRELMTHRLSGFYFLPRLEPQESLGCYVVLLRQIGAMPASIASKIPAGITAAEARENLPGAAQFLNLASRDDVVMPLGVLASPFIEHLMQTFSYLLARIGLPNTDPGHINRYVLMGDR